MISNIMHDVAQHPAPPHLSQATFLPHPSRDDQFTSTHHNWYRNMPLLHLPSVLVQDIIRETVRSSNSYDALRLRQINRTAPNLLVG